MKIKILGQTVQVVSNINFAMLLEASQKEPIAIKDSNNKIVYAANAVNDPNGSLLDNGVTFTHENTEGKACLTIMANETPVDMCALANEFAAEFTALKTYEDQIQAALDTYFAIRKDIIDEMEVL